MSTNTANAKVLPVECFYGKREVSTVATVADDAGSLNNKYFVFYSISENGAVSKIAPWINVNEVGTAPVVADATMVEVKVATGATAAAVATALSAALAAVTDCVASVSTSTVTIKNKYFGAVTAIADTGITGFTVASTVTGWGGSLGGTEDVDVSPEFSTTPVQFSQWGDTDLDQILIGQKCMVSFKALEITAAFWTNVLNRVFGESLTVGADKLLGFGTSKLFGTLVQYAGELILKPMNRADNDGNITFFKAMPAPSSINYSGTDLHGVELEFVACHDATRNSKIDIWFRGDETSLL